MNEATAPAGCAELKRMPSTSSTVLSLPRPRITGFWPCALSFEMAMPGSPRSASPTLAAPCRAISSASRVVVEIGVSRSAEA